MTNRSNPSVSDDQLVYTIPAPESPSPCNSTQREEHIKPPIIHVYRRQLPTSNPDPIPSSSADPSTDETPAMSDSSPSDTREPDLDVPIALRKGRFIVHQESPDKPWKRSRLWCHEESFKVLKQKKDKGNLLGLALDMRMLEKETNPQRAEKRQKQLTESCLKDKRLLGSLKILNLSFCEELRSLGGFEEFPALESYCNNLEKLPKTINMLKKLFSKELIFGVEDQRNLKSRCIMNLEYSAPFMGEKRCRIGLTAPDIKKRKVALELYPEDSPTYVITHGPAKSLEEPKAELVMVKKHKVAWIVEDFNLKCSAADNHIVEKEAWDHCICPTQK
ncbi:unnamed protein product [Lactuca virosa]|uniref:Uncharacterized protein n=1 Tax=Lactuca virosa TaxID=75947 RepID=A0AAU9NTG8_9ASTR|nr:unnamed protein product [Lactuca virosa]